MLSSLGADLHRILYSKIVGTYLSVPKGHVQVGSSWGTCPIQAPLMSFLTSCSYRLFPSLEAALLLAVAVEGVLLRTPTAPEVEHSSVRSRSPAAPEVEHSSVRFAWASSSLRHLSVSFLSLLSAIS